MTTPPTAPPEDDLEPELPSARRGFTLGPPEGFIELPLDEDAIEDPAVFEPLVARFAATFGLDAGHDSARAAAALFSVVGTSAGAGGVDYAALAFYRSPDDPQRPIMLLLSALTMPSDHGDVDGGVAGLLELHRNEGRGEATTFSLPAGPAVTVVTEQRSTMDNPDGEPVPMLTRQVAAWVPDTDGTTVGVVSVQTNSYQDWEHVCELAMDIFETFSWDPLTD